MAHLPWLVVHGTWVWGGALVVAAAAALGFAFGRPRLWARRLWARARHRVGPGRAPAPGLAGEVVTIAGRLEADGGCERFEDGLEVAAASVESSAFETMRARAPSLSVYCDGERVALEGEVEVAAGSQEYVPGKQPEKLAAEVRERIGVRGGSRWPVKLLVFRSLSRGDAVRARGTLAMRGAATGDYREAGHRFVLEDVTLISERPPRLRGPAPTRAIRPLLFAAVAYLGLFGLGGEILNHRSEKARIDSDAGFSEIMDVSTQLLATTPFRRDTALARLENRLAYGPPGVAEREALVAVHELRGDCAGAAESLLRHRALHRTLELASRCESTRARIVASRAAYLLGDVGRASDEIAGNPEPCSMAGITDCEQAVRAHLLAGKLDRAAALTKRMAATYRRKKGWMKEDDEAVRYRTRLATGFDCLTAAIEARAGDGDAAARLHDLVAERSANECALLEADLSSGEERAKLLTSWVERDGDPAGLSSLKPIIALLRLEGDPVGGAAAAQDPDSELAFRLRGQALIRVWIDDFSGGLERAILESLSKRDDLPLEARRLRGLLLAGQARDEALLLRYDEARELVSRAKQGIGEPPSAPDLPALAASIELRAGHLEKASAILEAARKNGARTYNQMDLARTLKALAKKSVPPRYAGKGRRMTRALERALSGDPTELAAELRENHYQESLFQTLATFAHWLPPRLLAHHLEVARLLSSYDLVNDIDRTITLLCQLALIADAAGLPERAAERAAAAEKLLDAKQRREIAVPLAVLEAL